MSKEKVKVKVICNACGHTWMSGANPENLKCGKCKSTDCKRDFSEPGMPNVSPREGKLPARPKTLTVCGNTIPVRGGKAAEADPKVLRRRRRKAARDRNLGPEEEKI